MKKTLLLILVLFAAANTYAADKVWNFSDLFTADVSGFEDGLITIVDNEVLGLSLKFSIDNTSSSSMKKWTTGSYHTRLKTGGSGAVGEANCVAIKVSGNSTIQVCAVSSSGSATRKLEVAAADGSVVGSALVDGNAGKDAAIAPPTFNYAGGETVLYIYSAQAVEGDGSYEAGGLNLYMISATNAVSISADDITAPSFLNENSIEGVIYFNGSEIINNQNLNLQVYNTLGKLVRTSNTNVEMNDLQSGIYIVRAEGVKGALKINK